MELSAWFVWVNLGGVVLQALGLVSAVRRLRGADPALRSKARFDLLETVGGLVFFGGLLLGLVVAEPWFWVGFAGMAFLSVLYGAKGARRLRARRRSAG
ncbi:hypothetical protein AB0E83_06680 [Streptomyces sp. NPDC035033]|uniref:hypothetical protein n=1 Tax=Streptomyces sp. NPDC035033 TaxID=3155368 RepID=UPI0033FB7576